jgi:CubicO group peptidase (beta-lactamase class C family)
MRDLVEAAFEPVAAAYRGWLDRNPDYSGQLAIYHRGEPVLDLTIGDRLQPDSLVPVFSSSKGAAGLVIALLVERGQLDLDAPVASYWPEFAAAGKADVQVRQLLSHQAGLLGVDGGFSDEELLAHTPLAQRLAEQRPLWRPGAGFSYHALTIGTLADELVRRITGRTLAEVFFDDVAAPREIDVHLGTPAELDHRVATVDLPPQDELLAYLARSPFPPRDSLAGMSAPRSDKTLLQRVNDEDFRRVGQPAAGGLATARGLARMYASIHHDTSGILQLGQLLSEDTIEQVSQTQVSGIDLGNNLHGRFAVVFQNPNPPRLQFGSARAFGHDGAGGSLGYVDPYYDLAVGYLSKTIHIPVDLDAGPDPRLDLTQVIRDCAFKAG